MTGSSFFDALLSVLGSGVTLTALLIFYAAVVTADIFKRRLLSNAYVYYCTMLLSPVAAAVSFLSVFAATGSGPDDDKIVLYLVGRVIEAALLLILSAMVYIRGHIKPVDDTSGQLAYADTQQVKISAAKRLILTGSLGAIIFGIIFILLFIALMMNFAWSVFILLFLMIPGINVLVVLILLAAIILVGTYIGAQAAMVFSFGAAALLMSFLVTNGCIRYILTTDKSREQKIRLGFLTFIPIYNVFYGINIIRKIN